MQVAAFSIGEDISCLLELCPHPLHLSDSFRSPPALGAQY